MLTQNLTKTLLLFSFLLALISCKNEDEKVSGCTNSEACNYNANAETSDGSCTFICLTDAEKVRVTNFVDSAIAYLDANGQAAAFSAFNDTTGNFIDNELYIFVWDSVANVLAHGFQHSLIGTNVMNLQDRTGKYFVQTLVQTTWNDGSGWEWYYWDDPVTNTIRKKFTYAKKHGELIVASGTYK